MEFFLNVVVDDAGTTIGIYLFQLHWNWQIKSSTPSETSYYTSYL